MSDFSNRLKRLRSDNKLTQKQLAEKLNVSQNAVYNWENGKREPNLDMMKRIAKVFDIALYTLLDDSYELPDTTSEAWKKRARFSGDTEMEHPSRFTVPMSNDVKKGSIKFHSTTGSVNEECLDDLKFNGMIQKKKRGGQLTAEEQIFYDTYLERGLRQALETAIKFYFMLNDDGKKKADAQITQFIEQLELLTKVPAYQKDTDTTDK